MVGIDLKGKIATCECQSHTVIETGSRLALKLKLSWLLLCHEDCVSWSIHISVYITQQTITFEQKNADNVFSRNWSCCNVIPFKAAA